MNSDMTEGKPLETEALIVDNLRLVYAVAAKLIRQRVYMEAEREDIVQEGMIGLIRAARTFRPEKGCASAVMQRG